MLDDNFYIVLPSNVQPEFHPENTASSYRTTFDRSYDLSNGAWDVGLVQMTFVNSLNNIVNESLRFRIKKAAEKTRITLIQDEKEFKSETIKVMYDETKHRYTLMIEEVNSKAEYLLDKHVAKKLGFASNEEMIDKSATAERYLKANQLPEGISKHDLYDMNAYLYFKFPENGRIEAKEPPVFPKTPAEISQPKFPSKIPIGEVIMDEGQVAVRRTLVLTQGENKNFEIGTLKLNYDGSKHRYTLIDTAVNSKAEYKIKKTLAQKLGFTSSEEMIDKSKIADSHIKSKEYLEGQSKHDVYDMKTHLFFKFPENGRIEATEAPMFPKTPVEPPTAQSLLPKSIMLQESTAEYWKESSVKLVPAYYSKPEELAARLNGEQTPLEQKLNPNAAKKKKPNPSYLFEFDTPENRFKVALEDEGELHLENGLHEILGFKDRILTKSQFADFAPLMNRGVYNFFIYCDICAPTQVGNVQTPLLQTVEVEGGKRWGQPQTIRFFKPMYVPVSTSAMNSIKIEIRDDTGQPVNFATGKTNLILHFRQRPFHL